MAKTVNRVTLLGNTGKDPEIRTTGGGAMVATFSLATTERSKDAQGNWQDKPEWHSLVAYGKLAEIVRDYVKKGSKLYIEGRLTTRSWDDKETSKKVYRTEIIVNELTLLSGREEGNHAQSSSSQSRPSYAQQTQPTRSVAANDQSFAADDEDIPF